MTMDRGMRGYDSLSVAFSLQKKNNDKNRYINLFFIDLHTTFVYGFAVPIDWETHQLSNENRDAFRCSMAGHAFG